jgi:hypothetical protein
VEAEPKFTTISPAMSKPTHHTHTTPRTSGKRSILTPSPEGDRSLPNMKRKAQKRASFSSSSESEMEVEEIIVDERPPRGERLKKVREELDRNRKIRREKMQAKYGRRGVQDEEFWNFWTCQPEPSTLGTPPQSVPPGGKIKRKGQPFFSITHLFYRRNLL